MSVRYNDDFKREVVRAYMAGNKSTVELAAEYNVPKAPLQNGLKNMVKNANTNIPLKKQVKVILQVKFENSTRCSRKKIKRLSS